MWQLEIAATNASSGSTWAGLDHGAGTTEGDGDAGTVKPPSNVQVCSREYLPLRKSGPLRFQSMMALCSDMGMVLRFFSSSRGRAEMRRVGGVGCRVVQHGVDGRHKRLERDKTGKDRAVSDGVLDQERRTLVDLEGVKLRRGRPRTRFDFRRPGL